MDTKIEKIVDLKGLNKKFLFLFWSSVWSHNFFVSDETHTLAETVNSSWEDIHVIHGPLGEEVGVEPKEQPVPVSTQGLGHGLNGIHFIFY